MRRIKRNFKKLSNTADSKSKMQDQTYLIQRTLNSTAT